jgi:glycosyltransferase involved in cell wall biosynthesis
VKKRVLFVGDAVVSTGFAKATHAYCAGLLAAGCDVHVLGMHHTGDPNEYDKLYPIYTCWPGGDPFGIGRVANIVKQVQPDLIVIQQDPWNFPQYLERLADYPDIPVVGVVAVDGKNCQGDKLGPSDVHPGLSHAIFWTQFGAEEARVGGWKGSSSVVPLGVDLDVYHPMDRVAVRSNAIGPVLRAYGFDDDAFIVGCIGRNQPRKRLDLTIQYFAEWVQYKNVKNAVLWMQCAPTGDQAFDIKMLAKYFGVQGRVLLPDVNPRYGVDEGTMAKVYNFIDVYLSTTVGEGWGLPAMEAMACGTPCVVPKWSAYAEWAVDAAWLAECISIAVAPQINTVGGVVGPEVKEALNRLYLEKHSWKALSDAGVKLASKPEHRWEHVGTEFAKIVAAVLGVDMLDVTTHADALPRFIMSDREATRAV